MVSLNIILASDMPLAWHLDKTAQLIKMPQECADAPSLKACRQTMSVLKDLSTRLKRSLALEIVHGSMQVSQKDCRLQHAGDST